MDSLRHSRRYATILGTILSAAMAVQLGKSDVLTHACQFVTLLAG